MESISLELRESLLDTFQSVHDAILQLQDWNRDISELNDLLTTPEGTKTLAADCMLLQAICEGIKKIDNKTKGSLLPLQPQIPWKEVKGMRDHIAHGYFDINTDLVWFVITEELDPLLIAVDWFINFLQQLEQK